MRLYGIRDRGSQSGRCHAAVRFYKHDEFVNTLPITGQRNAHAVVVVEVGSAQLTVYDPLDGERVLPQAPFLTAWAMMHNLALLIQR